MTEIGREILLRDSQDEPIDEVLICCYLMRIIRETKGLDPELVYAIEEFIKRKNRDSDGIE